MLTTEQIRAMAFSSDKVARRRLVMLFRASVLDRFQPYLAAGRRPEHLHPRADRGVAAGR